MSLKTLSEPRQCSFFWDRPQFHHDPNRTRNHKHTSYDRASWSITAWMMQAVMDRHRKVKVFHEEIGTVVRLSITPRANAYKFVVGLHYPSFVCL